MQAFREEIEEKGGNKAKFRLRPLIASEICLEINHLRRLSTHFQAPLMVLNHHG